MNTRKFALVWGIVFLGLAATGLIPGLLQSPHAGDPDLAVDAMHGRALGIFPVNILHTLVHAAFGMSPPRTLLSTLPHSSWLARRVASSLPSKATPPFLAPSPWQS